VSQIKTPADQTAGTTKSSVVEAGNQASSPVHQTATKQIQPTDTPLLAFGAL